MAPLRALPLPLALLFALLLALVAPLPGGEAAARPITPGEIPGPLHTWVPWVLQEVEDHGCPPLGSATPRACVWPGRLGLEVGRDGARFELQAEVFREAWLALPGDARLWPREVTLDGLPATVVERDGRPALRLAPGRYSVAGGLAWATRPEALPVPPDYALIDLELDGRRVEAPTLSAEGRLALEQDATQAGGGAEDRVEVEVFRRVVDDLPPRLLTRLELDVAGRAREVSLAGALPPAFIAMRLASPLPARLEPDGRLRLQLRPGRWTVELEARHPGPVSTLAMPPAEAPWPATEVWVFEARPALRVVEPTGVPLVDPRQTRLPADWQALPAFRLAVGDVLRLEERQRGDPEPEPNQLALERTLWLDLDGGGYTVADRISGRMTRGWRLEAGEGLALGRVALDGEPRFITTLGDSGRAGVEVRQGEVTLEADARLEGPPGRLPAAGWAQDFERASATLQLPPGWRLLAAFGVDHVPEAWVARWTLLDLFLVLIAALALGRLLGAGWGTLALLALTLLWHEPGAPRWVWLHLLAAMALLRVLPDGRLRRLAALYRGLALLALVALALPFAVDQLRSGLFPQLERPWVTGQGLMAQRAETAPSPLPARPAEDEFSMEAAVKAELEVAGASPGVAASVGATAVGSVAGPAGTPTDHDLDHAPGVLLQTGPGLPRWQWEAVRLEWTGPLTADQTLRLLLLSPGANLLLAALRVLLLAALLYALLAPLRRSLPGAVAALGAPAGVGLALCLALAGALQPSNARAEMPSPELLAELQRRLLAPEDCQPACADLARLEADIAADALRLRLDVHALARVAVPLPGADTQWLPAEVLVDGEPAAALRRGEDGQLRLVLEPGVHEVSLSGPLPARASFQLPLPLPAREVRVQAPGWRVDGLREQGGAEAQLIFTREAAAGAGAGQAALEPAALPGFVTVERTLRLGLDWRVETRVRRQTPAESGLALEIPLLPGESVTTPERVVAEGRVAVTLAAGEQEFGWDSVLEPGPSLELTAAETTDWVEVWRLDASPLWHVEHRGLPVVHHQDGAGRWLPTWQPWPGETLTLALTRPEGVPGRTLTLDASRLVLRPGTRATEAVLSLELRSSQGGRHTLTLPPGAELQSVSLDGRTQPIRQEGGRVSLPLAPGTQQAELRWRTPAGLEAFQRTPTPELGAPGVNAEVEVEMPRDRWTLAVGGPALGPAVFFWAVLPLLALVALALGRLRLTPLASRHWLLLGLGLTQTPVVNALLVGGWLLALGLRGRLRAPLGPLAFNALQLALALLGLLALGALVESVRMGLLGLPEMQIGGNGSTAQVLRWYQDRSEGALPGAWVLSAPLWVYRALMLAWALWLAFALLGWLRWGWGCFTAEGLWRPLRWRRVGGEAAGERSAS